MHWQAAHLPDAAFLPMTKLPLTRDSGSHQSGIFAGTLPSD